MFTRSDLIDVLRRHLAPVPVPAPTSVPRDGHQDPGCLKPLCGRRFLTEYEIKQALTPQMKRLTIPKDAIVSPLALDWLALKGVRIVRTSQ